MYRSRCSLCHDGGATGAPRTGRPEDWKERVAKGRVGLHGAALRGVPDSAMTPKGGHVDLSDAEVIAAVDFMLAGITVPSAPAAARPAPNAAPRKPAVQVDDRSLALNVADALRLLIAPTRSVEDRDGPFIHGVKVAARSGRIQLSGVVKDTAMVRSAEQAALAVPGVSGVENKLVPGDLFEHD